jgi:hypothetical protein
MNKLIYVYYINIYIKYIKKNLYIIINKNIYTKKNEISPKIHW